MKFFLKVLSVFILVITLNSCEKENEQLLPNEESLENVTESNLKTGTENTDSRSSGICELSIVTSNRSSYVRIGETKTFRVSGNVPRSTTLKWSVIDGAGIQVIGSTTSRAFTVRFNAGFTIGAIRLETDYSSDCNKEFSVYLRGFSPICAKIKTPPMPSPIYSDFGADYPNGYIPNNLGQNYICTGTIANELSVPFEPCVTYSWSISPAGNSAIIYPTDNNAIVLVKKTGTYKVTLRSSNRNGTRIEQFILKAEDCDTVGGGGFGF